MKQKLGRELLEIELREHNYTGDVDKLIDSAGSLSTAWYYWDNKLRQEVDSFQGKAPRVWIESRFKKDAKVFYDYWMHKKFSQVTGNKT